MATYVVIETNSEQALKSLIETYNVLDGGDEVVLLQEDYYRLPGCLRDESNIKLTFTV